MNPSSVDKRTGGILPVLGIIPVVWAALMVAPFLSDGLAGVIEGFSSGTVAPLRITWCVDSPRAILLFLLVYGLGIGVYLATKRNYRKGEEHGSAKWGSAAQIVKKYANKDKPYNILLTQHTRMKKLFTLFCVMVMMLATSAVAFADGDPIAVVNNFSEFIFGLIRAIGMILLAFGIVQVGLSLKSHDPSQRANGFLTLAGGIVITFTKEILGLITG